MIAINLTILTILILTFTQSLQIQPSSTQYIVKVTQRDSQPLLSYLIQNNSQYKQAFNPTWIQPTIYTNKRKGVLARIQDCDYEVGKCIFCGGGANKASLMAYSEEVGDKFQPISRQTIVFAPHNFSDGWGTEDPRMRYNKFDQLYYMMYTAYNGSAIYLNLATTKNPFDANQWERLGRVFADYPNSKSGALLFKQKNENYLFWGDSVIRVTKSTNPKVWQSIGQTLISPRQDHFDSKLVQSGPPPLKLSNGNYLFFYNSAEIGWPQDRSKSYNVGWVILDGKDLTKIISRSSEPLMSSKYAWQKGEAPYLCNVPNVVFLQGAEELGSDRFRVFFGAGDAAIGSAIVQVNIS